MTYHITTSGFAYRPPELMIVFWFCIDLSFLDCEFSILIFTLHQPLLGRIKATRGLLLLAAEISHGTDAFPVLWLARAVTLAQLSDRAANQSDSDICSEPRGEPRRLRLSICVHCNLAAPRSRQENPRPLLAAYGRDRIALCSLPRVVFRSLPQPASPWQPCVCSCWPCRPRRSWPSRRCIFGSSLKTEVSPPFTQKIAATV